MTHDQFEKIYKSNEEKFLNVIKFISENRRFKTKADAIINAKAIHNKGPAKERIRIIFIDALSASGGANLTRNGEACKFFNHKINQLNDTLQVDLQTFYKCFDIKINSIKDLFEYLWSSKEIVNFRKKKSALFLYKLNSIQTDPYLDQKIFTNYNIEELDLFIPVDVVITLVINRIFNVPDNLLLDQYKDFDLINTFFKSVLPDKFLLIEDFWFWGYFTTKVIGIGRTFEFNHAKFESSDLINPDRENEAVIKDFLKIIKN